MSNTVIIIPSRLKAKRLPDKPLKLINGKEMIIHVHDVAKKSGAGEVLVATADKEIDRLVKKNNGMSFLSLKQHETGSDRVYEAFNNFFSSKPEVIINLQGDMPLIDPKDIERVNRPIKQGFDIGTLVTNLNDDQINDQNVTKAKVQWINQNKIGKAIDFSKKEFNITNKNIYQHVGIYSFRLETLKKFVSLSPSKNEIQKKLEQFRALDANMTIGVSYVKNIPISVDTKEDLLKIENIMKNL